MAREIGRQEKTLFQRKFDWFELAFLTFVSAGLLFFDSHTGASQNVARSALSSIAAPIQYMVDAPSVVIKRFSFAIQTHQQLLEENQTLKYELLKTRLRLQAHESVERKNQLLEELLFAKETHNYSAQIARILSIDLEPYRQRVVINKGIQDGAFSGQTAIDPHGLVGKVTTVTPLTSEVLMISDASFSVPVMVSRNGVRAITYGTGFPNKLEIKHILGEADIRVGDILLTSGLGGAFPEGHPVAIITKIAFPENKEAAYITAKPIAALDRLQSVLLLNENLQSEEKS